MKTTLEIPDSTFRRAKTFAAARGISLKKLVTDALEEKLHQPANVLKAAPPPWMTGFGALADLKTENAKIIALIEEEFERIEPEDEG
ncbi:MAG: hypothetical protein L0Z50_07175 [Verrucomicrobiales bacterium]|nr:hypothetical protein [Verrucomicrobiales bacterium]